jgi:hypothetical protein
MTMEKMKTEKEERDGTPPITYHSCLLASRPMQAPRCSLAHARHLFSLMFLFCSDDQEDTPFWRFMQQQY